MDIVVTLSGRTFSITEAAFIYLKQRLDEILGQQPIPIRNVVKDDLEIRLADYFCQRGNPVGPISVQDVDDALIKIGFVGSSSNSTGNTDGCNAGSPDGGSTGESPEPDSFFSSEETKSGQNNGANQGGASQSNASFAGSASSSDSSSCNTSSGNTSFGSSSSDNRKTLYRSKKNSVLAGICGGLGVWSGIDPVVVRIIFLLLVVFAQLWIVPLYVIMWIIVPSDPQESAAGGDTSKGCVLSCLVVLVLLILAIPAFIISIKLLSMAMHNMLFWI